VTDAPDLPALVLAPFDLIFADGGMREAAAFRAVVGWLWPGGRIVTDDGTRG
jgi:hypothetical protein